MNYRELRDALIRDVGRASVYFAQDPGLTGKNAATADFIITNVNGPYEVGGLDRGDFVVGATFATEDQACAYVYDKIISRSSGRGHRRSAEEEQRSAEAMQETMAEFNRLFPGAQPC